MPNNIGLLSRATESNGYTQKHSSSKSKCISSPLDEIAPVLKKARTGILEHDRKRKIELCCVEYQQMLEDEGYSEEETNKRVSDYRASLLEENPTVIAKIDRDKPKHLVESSNGNCSEVSADNERATKYEKIIRSEDASDLVEKITKELTKSKKRRRSSSPKKSSKKKKKKKHKRKSERSKKSSKHGSKSKSERKKHKKRTSSRLSTSPVKSKSKRSLSSSSKREKFCVDKKHQRRRKNSSSSPSSNYKNYREPTTHEHRKRNTSVSKKSSISDYSKDKKWRRSCTRSVERRGRRSYTRSVDRKIGNPHSRKKRTTKRSCSRDKKVSKSKSRRQRSYDSPSRHTKSSDSGYGFDDSVDSRRLSTSKSETKAEEKPQKPTLIRIGSISMKYDEEEYEDDSDIDLSNSLHDDSQKSNNSIGMEIFAKLKSESKAKQHVESKNNRVRKDSSSSPLSYSPVEKYPQRYLDILSDMPKRSRLQISEVLEKISPCENDRSQNTSKVDDKQKEDISAPSVKSVSEGELTSVKFTFTSTALRTVSVPGLSCKSAAEMKTHNYDEMAPVKLDEPEESNVQPCPLFDTESPCHWKSPSKSRSPFGSVRSERSCHSRSSSSDSSLSNCERSPVYELACRKRRRRHRSHSSSADGRESANSSSCSSISSVRSDSGSGSGSRSSSRDRLTPPKKRKASYRSSCSSACSSVSSRRSRSRSLSIPRRRGSPSFLDRRRITSQ